MWTPKMQIVTTDQPGQLEVDHLNNDEVTNQEVRPQRVALADGSNSSILPNPFFHSGTNLKELAAQAGIDPRTFFILPNRFPSSKDRFPAGPRALLGWFQSRRKGLGRINYFTLGRCKIDKYTFPSNIHH